MLNKKKDFREENLISWDKNSDYWLTCPLRQVEDTKSFFQAKLKELVKPGMTIIDMGCGSGYLLDYLMELDIEVSYIGLDFNKKFINYLNQKHTSHGFAQFHLIDLEERIPEEFLGKADLVFNCFNFFELADLDTAFSNGVMMLKKSGRMVIFTIDVLFLILAISKTMKDFKANLKNYEISKNKGEVPYFFQHIDLGHAESQELKYASVLYSLDDFYDQAKRHNLRLIDYCEVIKTSKFLPKVYQFIVFK